MEKRKWLMPTYYKNFKCKANDCRHSCCHFWKIPISQHEYFKLIGMDCSEELHNKLDIAFEDPRDKDESCFKYISFNWLGDCPVNKDGLCLLHKEKGEEHLPKICRLYPRSLKRINDTFIACCSSSCEAVVEELFNCGQLTLVEEEADYEPQIEIDVDNEDIEVLLKYNEILRDRSTTLVESIRDICLLVNKEEFIKEYNININPLDEALNILNRFANSHNFLSDINSEIRKRYVDNYYQFEIDRDQFEKRFPNWMYFFENVLNNSLLYENFPFVDSRFDNTNAFKGLCVSYGLLRLVAIGYSSIHSSKDDLIDAVAELFHLIDHTAFYYNINIICNCAALLLKI